MKPKPIVTYDARVALQAGREPFAEIMRLVSEVQPGQTLIIISPFLPSPLIERLQPDGFKSRAVRRSDGGWETHFTLPPA
jgi:uncharacterized protein (DUF2249 family)